MSKIYEALQHAYKEKTVPEERHSNVPASFKTAVQGPHLEMDEEMLGLYKSIDTLLPATPNKVIQFIGTSVGEGTSTIARAFARLSATRVGCSVLLLDADRHMSTQSLYFDVMSEQSWIEALKKGDTFGNAVYQVGQSSLFVSPSCNSSVATPEIFNSPRFADFWGSLRQTYDLILVDCAPLAVSPDGLALASKVDGVVLVVEAEKTRWQTAKNLRESIQKVGGNVLGAVFNKRRFYIPQSVYKHL